VKLGDSMNRKSSPRSLLLALMIGLSVATSLLARDIYVVQGDARGPVFGQERVVWSTDVLFYNRGVAPGTVTVLSISNPSDRGGRVGASFAVSPGKTASLQQQLRGIPNGDALMIVHLDVDEALVVENVLYIGSEFAGGISGNTIFRQYGKIRLPVFTSFVPANEPQVHLESDIGDIPAHINVGIYNAGSETATAHIETHAHCDDGTISTRTVSVPPDTVVQIAGFQAETQCAGLEQKSSVYTVVTVDQPSLTFVSALANDNTPTTSISIGGY
jgi:hypothetical protein